MDVSPDRDGGGAGQGRRHRSRRGGDHDGRLELVAPAKVNLALLVGPRRRDGHHEVFSLMVPITLADRVVAERATRGVTVECDVCPGEANLAARAVRALEAWAGRSFPIKLRIEKRIPAGAGLGGGSSDAAAAVRAVDELYGLDVPAPALYRIAGDIGADVPFFLWPGAQIAMGRGSVLSPVELPGPLFLVVVVPDLELSTADVYRWRDQDAVVGLREFAAATERLRQRLRSVRRPLDLASIVGNDLERHVVARAPVVGQVKERLLRAGAAAAAMSGSGSSVFGLFPGPEEAAAAASALRGRAAEAAATEAVGSQALRGRVSAAPGHGEGAPGLRVFEVSDLQPLGDGEG